MCKGTKKKNKYNQTIVKQLAKRYSVSISMVIKSLSQTRTSEKEKDILKEYKRISLVLDNLTETMIKQI